MPLRAGAVPLVLRKSDASAIGVLHVGVAVALGAVIG